MRRRAWAAGLALAASLAYGLPVEAQEAGRVGRVVNTEGGALRVRAAPDTGAPILKRLGPGWRLTVLGNHGGDGSWLRVEHGGTIGYVAAEFVALDDGVNPSTAPARASRSGWVTNTDGANLRLRAAARPTAEILKRLAPGWQVTILEGPFTDASGAAWVRLEHAGTTGFAAAEYVAGAAAGGGDARPSPAVGRKAVRERVRLRTEPGLASTVVTTLAPGTIVESTGREREADGYRWAGVRAVGRDGWVVADALSDAPGADTGRQLADAVLAQVGQRYVWGGETPAGGFDCSGLVRYVVKSVMGVDLTHVMARQVEAGRPVERDQLAVGDLVFFENTYKPGLSHNGIYIGDGQFVSALNEQTGVVLGRLESPYWKTRWYGARRLIG